MSIRISQPEGGFKPVMPQKNSPRCKDCPAFDKGWCKQMARLATPMAGMCEWGKRKRRSQAVMKCKKKHASRAAKLTENLKEPAKAASVQAVADKLHEAFFNYAAETFEKTEDHALTVAITAEAVTHLMSELLKVAHEDMDRIKAERKAMAIAKGGKR